MTLVFDAQRNEIGHFYGKFVYDRNGGKIYWIEDGEVFSLPFRDGDCQLKNRPSIKLGNLIDGVASSTEGDVIFFLE